MAKFRSHKSSLLGGELAPQALGRTDLPQYAAACKTLKNMIPMLSGGAYRRPGTKYEVTFKGNEGGLTLSTPVLIPFISSQTDAYVIALLRRLDNDTALAYGYRATSAADTNSEDNWSYFLSGTHPYRVATLANGLQYDEAHDVQWAQSADVMWLVHPNHKPRKIQKTAGFTISEFDNNLSSTTLRDAWPYLAQNATSTTITCTGSVGVAGASITVSASASLFNSGHVGAMFKINDGATIGAFKITAVTNSISATATVVVPFSGSGTPTLLWWESAWSDYRGWPRSVAFFSNRLIYGGTTSYPDTIWLSEDYDYNQLSKSTIQNPVQDPAGQEPFTITLPSKQLNQIQWMSGEKSLIVGTSAEEVIIGPVPITPETATAVIQSRYGSSYSAAVRAGNETIFSTVSQDEVRALIFNESEDSYVADPIQVLYGEKPLPEPIINSLNNRRFRRFMWDESRKTLWCVDTAGNLFGLTRDRRLGVNTWHSHEMGGYDASVVQSGAEVPTLGGSALVDPAYRICTGSVVSMALVPNPILGMNDLWLVVKRKVGSNYDYFIERMIGGFIAESSAFKTSLAFSGNYYADASKMLASDDTYSIDYVLGENQHVWFDHLYGFSVVGTANNSRGLFTTGTPTFSDVVQLIAPILEVPEVTGRVLTITAPLPPNIDNETTYIAYGIPFTSIIEPVRIEAGSQIGSAQGAVKRIHEATIRFYKTLAAKVGRDSDNLETLVFREGSTFTGYSPDLFTGDKRVKLMSDYDRDGLIYIECDQPLPFCVVSVTAEGVLYD